MIGLARRVLHYAFPVAVFGRRLYRRLLRPVTVGVRALVLHENQVLLIRQHGDAEWLLPGGAANRGETLREAAIREAREETGCIVVAERLLGVFSTIHEGMTNHVAVFVCNLAGSTKPRVAGKLNIEIADARFWPLDALPANLHATARQWLAASAAGERGLDGRI